MRLLPIFLAVRRLQVGLSHDCFRFRVKRLWLAARGPRGFRQPDSCADKKIPHTKGWDTEPVGPNYALEDIVA